MKKHLITITSFAALFTVAHAAQPPVISTFENDFDGWTSTVGVNWQSSGGNPNGYLRFIDSGPANGGQLFAPSKFLGDWTSFDGSGQLSYDFRVFQTGPPYFARGVRISGPGGTASWTGPTATDQTGWTKSVVPIRADAWTVSAGRWADILTNVTELFVGMPVSSSAVETTGIDNVLLSVPPTNAPPVQLSIEQAVQIIDYCIIK